MTIRKEVWHITEDGQRWATLSEASAHESLIRLQKWLREHIDLDPLTLARKLLRDFAVTPRGKAAKTPPLTVTADADGVPLLYERKIP
jgi:hypothetical protein